MLHISLYLSLQIIDQQMANTEDQIMPETLVYANSINVSG
jgi:hypothetical protein